VTGHDDNCDGGNDDSVVTLGGPTKSSSKSRKGGIGVPAASGGTSTSALTAGANIDGASPPLLNPALPHLAAMLDKADVVIKVLNVRDPLVHCSSALEARVALKGGGDNKAAACAQQDWCVHTYCWY
jgi:hypothetical protein